MSSSSLGPSVSYPLRNLSHKSYNPDQNREILCGVCVSVNNTKWLNKKQPENLTYNQEKKSTEADVEMTQMFEMDDMV